MNSGIVMEVNEKHIIVMTSEGRFDQIPAKNRSCQVGEEISFAPRHFRYRYPTFSTVSVFAAAVMFCMILFSTLPGLFADKTVVAYVSIDINPSVEAGIDGKNIVREARGLNDQGNALIGSLKFKGKTIGEFTETLLQKAEEKQYLKDGEGDIVIASTLVSDGAKVDDNLLSENLRQQVLTHFVTEYPDQTPAIQVTAFAAPKEAREEARNQGLSLGKYSVYLGAKSTGHDLKIEDFKADSVHTIAKENGGIGKLVDGSKLKKENIKELLQGEKDGTLDKQVQETKKKEEEAKKQGKTNTKTVNPSPKPGPSATPTQKPTPSPSKTQQKSNESSRPRDIKKQETSDNEKDNGGKQTVPDRTAAPREQDDFKKDNGRQDEKKDNENKDNGNKDNKKDISTAEEKEQDFVKTGNSSHSDKIEEKTEEKQDRASRGDHEKEPKREIKP